MRRPRSAPTLTAALGVSFLAVGCGRAEGPVSGSPIAERDSAGIVLVDNDLLRLTDRCALEAEPSVVIGTAIGEPAYQLHRVFGATVLGDGRIVLVNQGSQELRFYDAEGRFLHAAGSEGDGPGEFRNAFLIWRQAGDTLWVGDNRPWRFEVFTSSGTWVRGVRTPDQPGSPLLAGLLADGRAILGFRDWENPMADFSLERLPIVLHDRDGLPADTLELAPYGRWGVTTDDPGAIRLYPWFEAVTEMTARGDRWVIGHGASPELRVHRMDPGPGLERIVRWSGADRTIDPSDLEAAKAEIEARYATIEDPGLRRMMVEPLVSDRRPVAESMPVMSDLLLGPNGSIWVQEYERPGGDGLTDWLRFDPAGRFVCRLAVPSGVEAYEFGADYLLGHREGELGAEQVVVYRLGGPQG